jgi:hypothetical protein
MASWHGADLSDILSQMRVDAERLAVEFAAPQYPPFFPGRTSEQALRAAEKDHGRSIPDPVRQLYGTIHGLTFDDWKLRERATRNLIVAISETYWPHPLDVDDCDERWNRDDYFVFAQTTWGDEIVYCERPHERPPGSIIMLDHEKVNNNPSESYPEWLTQVVFLADSLAEWLARWRACGYVELAMTGQNDRVAPDILKDFLEDHIRLNPRVVWAREKLKQLGGT